jgi:hypothetical protein
MIKPEREHDKAQRLLPQSAVFSAPVEAFGEMRTYNTTSKSSSLQKSLHQAQASQENHKVSKSQSCRLLRLPRRSRCLSAVRNADEQYKDAPLSGFRNCHEKDACTVNMSEKLPRNTVPPRSRARFPSSQQTYCQIILACPAGIYIATPCSHP